MKITFKQYLAAKEQLRKVIHDQPKQTLTYKVIKYVKLPIIIDSDRIDVDLRPGYILKIMWLYKDIDDKTPDPIGLTVELNNTEEDVLPFWKKQKFTEWVKKNTIQIY
jgi:hypothetical protein